MKTFPILGVASLLALSGLAVAIAQPPSQPATPPSTQPAPTTEPAAAKPAEAKPADAKAPAGTEKIAPADPASPKAQAPTSGDMFESADGSTKLPVVNTREIKLVIQDLKIGDGKECPPGAQVVINYHGQLLDGFVFDTTRGKQPADFPLGRLIQGWQMGIPGMKVGGQRRLIIPPELGYGARDVGQRPDGSGPLIPKNSTLVFTIELKEVK